MASMTSRSFRPAGRATPMMWTSRGRWARTDSSSRCSRPRWTASYRPETAGIIGKLGGLAVLNLEGIWTRYEDADDILERIAGLPKDEATREMQEIYQEPVKEELIAQRIAGDQGARRRRRRVADSSARRALPRALS